MGGRAGKEEALQRKPAGSEGGQTKGNPRSLPHPGLAGLTSIIQAGYFPAEAGGTEMPRGQAEGKACRAIGLRLFDLSNQTASFVDQRTQVPHSGQS